MTPERFLHPGEGEILKGAVHAAVCGLALVCGIYNAAAWLTRRAVPGRARWTEYPPDQTFERTLDYLAASALVMHTLHTVAGPRNFDPLWLDQLPQRVPGPIENEVAKGYVFRSKTQFTLDDVRHYPFPWMLRVLSGFTKALIVRLPELIR